MPVPFKSESQRRFLWAKHPKVAKHWAHEGPGQKNLPEHVKKASLSVTAVREFWLELEKLGSITPHAKQIGEALVRKFPNSKGARSMAKDMVILDRVAPVRQSEIMLKLRTGAPPIRRPSVGARLQSLLNRLGGKVQGLPRAPMPASVPGAA